MLVTHKNNNRAIRRCHKILDCKPVMGIFGLITDGLLPFGNLVKSKSRGFSILTDKKYVQKAQDSRILEALVIISRRYQATFFCQRGVNRV